MTTKKLTDNEKRLTISLIISGVAIVLLFIWLVSALHEASNANMVLDAGCETTVSPSLCRQGMEMLKGMTRSEIKDYFKKYGQSF